MYRFAFLIFVFTFVFGVFFAFGIIYGNVANAQSKKKGKTRVVYPKKSNINFDGIDIEGELKNPGEFYFQVREEEKFDSLVKRRKNFHREMLRDVVMSK